MSKKKVLIALAVATALTVPFSVFAATSDTTAAKNIRGFFRIDTTKLTDAQKEDVKDYSQKMADLQKDFINKMVENGSMTKEQGEAATQKIDETIKNSAENGYIPGFGMGKGGFGGHGKGGGFGIGNIDTSKLTDAQKADLKVTYTKIVSLHKDLISKAVTKGVLTKTQGDDAAKKIDEISKNIESGNYTADMMMGKGGFIGFGIRGIDNSKLTDEQKTIFTDFTNSMNELHKELVDKLVANGAMTKEQGDAAIQRIDNMKDFSGQEGLPGGKGMKNGRFGGKGRQLNPATDTNSNTTSAS